MMTIGRRAGKQYFPVSLIKHRYFFFIFPLSSITQ